jgi:hypothetical protein
MRRFILGLAALTLWEMSGTARADLFTFSTGNPDGKIGMASRPGPGPGGGPNQETEAADDFITTASKTIINHATFTGLVPAGVNLGTDIAQLRVEIYRVFPKDSDVGRTSGAPFFSTALVPTRVNSPSDVEFDDRDSATGKLTFTASALTSSFTAANSVDLGIHPKPNQFTGGDGPVTGQEVLFDVTFTTPFQLPADHYFFVPQVLLVNPDDHFLWLSAPKPIVAPGTPFAPDLQTWIRNADLDPDWLRVGTDITNQGPFNGAFSLSGQAVPEPSTFALLGLGTLGLLGYQWRRRRPVRSHWS